MGLYTSLHALLLIWGAAWLSPPVPVGPAMHIDIPANNSVMAQTFTLAGWAIDTDASSGTGVDAIEVWGYPNPGSGAAPIYFGGATYGAARPDIAAAFGAQFTNAGWYLNVVGRPPAVYEIHAYARSTVTGTFNQERWVTVTVTADPRMAVDLPSADSVQQPFPIVGWAIDLAAGTGTGVSTVHVWSRRLDVPGSPDQLVGAATYGAARPDVGAAFGVRFTNSAYSQTVTGLSPGRYRFTVYARSTLTETFNQATVLDLDVSQTVAPPVFSVAAGTYTASFTADATSATPQAIVRYTTNGTDPTASSSTTPPMVDVPMTVKAKAFRAGWATSATTTVAYGFQPVAPVFSAPSGAFTAAFWVTVTSPTPLTEVRYTTNGTEPTVASPLMVGLQYSVSATVTLKVKAFRTGWSPSATTTAIWRSQW